MFWDSVFNVESSSVFLKPFMPHFDVWKTKHKWSGLDLPPMVVWGDLQQATPFHTLHLYLCCAPDTPQRSCNADVLCPWICTLLLSGGLWIFFHNFPFCFSSSSHFPSPLLTPPLWLPLIFLFSPFLFLLL